MRLAACFVSGVWRDNQQPNQAVNSSNDLNTVETSSAQQATEGADLSSELNSLTAINSIHQLKPLLQTVLIRWLAISVCWFAGALLWTHFPFFQRQIGQAARDWIWNISYAWLLAGWLWEGILALVNRTNYIQSKSQSIIALQAVFYTFISFFKFPILQKLRITTLKPEESKQAFLFFAVRIFYLPLMLHFLLGHQGLWQWPISWSDLQFKFSNMFWLQDFIYFVDVLPFVAAYLINYGEYRTRSVNSTAVGWLFCLSCYPPFNEAWGQIFPYAHEETSGWLSWMCLLSISIYSWASVALGLRAGHLQYRGLCQSGPYAFVRHPAYAFKNLAWLIGSVSWLVSQINASHGNFSQISAMILWNVVGSTFWIWVYHMRAVTEEEHLLHYPEYRAYCEKVKYRYIPGLF